MMMTKMLMEYQESSGGMKLNIKNLYVFIFTIKSIHVLIFLSEYEYLKLPTTEHY